MDIRKLFADQIENAEEITQERFDEIVETRLETARSAGMEVDEEQVQEVVQAEYPVGDKVLYALIVQREISVEVPADDTNSALATAPQELALKRTSIQVVTVAESELDDFAASHVYIDTPENIPRFMPRNK